VLHHWVFHGIFTEVGLSLESKCQLLDGVVRYDRVVVAELLRKLISFQLFLKRVEDVAEEA
jgi:hypothetical protein